MPATLAAIRRSGRGGEVVAAIQGPSPVLRPLLDLGFRIVDRDQYMASEPDLFDPARLDPQPGMLLRRSAPSRAHPGQAGTATGFSIGTPTMLPHSVQLPS